MARSVNTWEAHLIRTAHERRNSDRPMILLSFPTPLSKSLGNKDSDSCGGASSRKCSPEGRALRTDARESPQSYRSVEALGLTEEQEEEEEETFCLWRYCAVPPSSYALPGEIWRPERRDIKLKTSNGDKDAVTPNSLPARVQLRICTCGCEHLEERIRLKRVWNIS